MSAPASRGSDPFGYTLRQHKQVAALNSAPKARPSFGFIGRAVHAVRDTENFRNSLQRAEAGLSYNKKSMNAKQLKILAAVYANRKGR